MRVVLDEEKFKEYVNNGSVVIEGRTIISTKENLNLIIKGKVAHQGDIQYILSDIGTDRINNIIFKK